MGQRPALHFQCSPSRSPQLFEMKKTEMPKPKTQVSAQHKGSLDATISCLRFLNFDFHLFGSSWKWVGKMRGRMFVRWGMTSRWEILRWLEEVVCWCSVSNSRLRSTNNGDTGEILYPADYADFRQYSAALICDICGRCIIGRSRYSWDAALYG